MRVIGGKFKGRRFDPPEKLGIRPTTDRAREALFNILTHTYEVDGCTALDLFAGSGLMSLEFLSRGAASVTSVEQLPQIVRHLTGLQRLLALEAEWEIIHDKAERFITYATETFDLIFLDPPYLYPDKTGLLDAVFAGNLLHPDGLLIFEHAAGETLSAHPGFIEQRTYSSSTFSFFRHVGNDEGVSPGVADDDPAQSAQPD